MQIHIYIPRVDSTCVKHRNREHNKYLHKHVLEVLQAVSIWYWSPGNIVHVHVHHARNTPQQSQTRLYITCESLVQISLIAMSELQIIPCRMTQIEAMVERSHCFTMYSKKSPNKLLNEFLGLEEPPQIEDLPCSQK